MASSPMTPSEAMVYELCQRSFLAPWSYPRPWNAERKELCDALVVCEPDVILFSVKEIGLSEKADPRVAAERWQRKAIDASAAQLYGAVTALGRLDHVIQEDGTPGLPLPPSADRRVHLVAVAVGGNRQVPVYAGDLGKGHVHVFDEVAFGAVLAELDTVEDFVEYLRATRAYHERGGRMVLMGGEENLLALYVHRGRTLPPDVDMLVLDDDLWAKVQQKPEWRARKAADHVSYTWDRLIERIVADDGLPLRAGPTTTEAEKLVRTMARENRFSRRHLGGAFLDWLQGGQSGARLVRSATTGVVYLYLTTPRDWERQRRAIELQGRCFVARGMFPDATTVIGVATEIYDPSGFSLDACYLYMSTWTTDDEEHARHARENFDWFHTPQYFSYRSDEFPTSAPRGRKPVPKKPPKPRRKKNDRKRRK